MRYPKYVSLSIHDLSQLITAWNKFAVDPKSLGECVFGESYAGLIKDLNQQCEIRITPTQLYNLCWYYKHCVLERLSHLHKRLPTNYYKLFENLSKQAPGLFEVAPDGEIKMKESKEILGIYEKEDDQSDRN